MVLVEIADLVPDLRGTGYGAKRGLHLWRQPCPGGKEGDDGQHGHAQKTPDLFDLRARVVTGDGAQHGRDPAHADHLEIAICLVDAGEKAGAALGAGGLVGNSLFGDGGHWFDPCCQGGLKPHPTARG